MGSAVVVLCVAAAVAGGAARMLDPDETVPPTGPASARQGLGGAAIKAGAGRLLGAAFEGDDDNDDEQVDFASVGGSDRSAVDDNDGAFAGEFDYLSLTRGNARSSGPIGNRHGIDRLRALAERDEADDDAALPPTVAEIERPAQPQKILVFSGTDRYLWLFTTAVAFTLFCLGGSIRPAQMTKIDASGPTKAVAVAYCKRRLAKIARELRAHVGKSGGDTGSADRVIQGSEDGGVDKGDLLLLRGEAEGAMGNREEKIEYMDNASDSAGDNMARAHQEELDAAGDMSTFEDDDGGGGGGTAEYVDRRKPTQSAANVASATQGREIHAESDDESDSDWSLESNDPDPEDDVLRLAQAARAVQSGTRQLTQLYLDVGLFRSQKEAAHAIEQLTQVQQDDAAIAAAESALKEFKAISSVSERLEYIRKTPLVLGMLDSSGDELAEIISAIPHTLTSNGWELVPRSSSENNDWNGQSSASTTQCDQDGPFEEILEADLMEELASGAHDLQLDARNLRKAAEDIAAEQNQLSQIHRNRVIQMRARLHTRQDLSTKTVEELVRKASADRASKCQRQRIQKLRLERTLLVEAVHADALKKREHRELLLQKQKKEICSFRENLTTALEQIAMVVLVTCAWSATRSLEMQLLEPLNGPYTVDWPPQSNNWILEASGIGGHIRNIRQYFNAYCRLAGCWIVVALLSLCFGLLSKLYGALGRRIGVSILTSALLYAAQSYIVIIVARGWHWLVLAAVLAIGWYEVAMPHWTNEQVAALLRRIEGEGCNVNCITTAFDWGQTYGVDRRVLAHEAFVPAALAVCTAAAAAAILEL